MQIISSRLERHEDDIKQPSIDDSFPDEFILVLHHFVTPWFADFVNYLTGGVLSNDLSYQKKKRFLYKVRQYLWEEPFLYKIGGDGLIRYCIPDLEVHDILSQCHDSVYEGHYGPTKTVAKVLECGSFDLHCSRMQESMYFIVINVNVQEVFLRDMKYHSHKFKKWRFLTFRD